MSVLRADQEDAHGPPGALRGRQPREVPRATLRDAGTHGAEDGSADLLQLQAHRRIRRHQEAGEI